MQLKILKVLEELEELIEKKDDLQKIRNTFYMLEELLKNESNPLIKKIVVSRLEKIDSRMLLIPIKKPKLEITILECTDGFKIQVDELITPSQMKDMLYDFLRMQKRTLEQGFVKFDIINSNMLIIEYRNQKSICIDISKWNFSEQMYKCYLIELKNCLRWHI